MMRKLLFIIPFLCFAGVLQSKEYRLQSPSGEITVTVTTGDKTTWSIDYRGERLMDNSAMSMKLGNSRTALGDNAKVTSAKTIAVNGTQTAEVPTKRRVLEDRYNELELKCKGGYSIIYRAYDNGVAYRFVTQMKGKDVKVEREEVVQNWAKGVKAYWPIEKNQEYITHCEAKFEEKPLTELTREMKGYLPIYMTTPTGTKVVMTETDLSDYPNLFLTGDGSGSLTGEFPPVVLKSRLREGKDRDEEFLEKANYIASTKGARTYPWRLYMIDADDKGVIENALAYQLASGPVAGDKAWIEPGQISWDWWSTLNVYGVDFKVGVNTATYKYFIDFASKYGVKYVLLDEGWSAGTWNIKESIPELDIPELVEYGKQKGVGLVLWTLWNPLDKDLEGILDVYKAWGIKGIKVDFMQRMDQYMVNFYERVGKAAFDRNMLVDFHGAFKPCGLQRKYPNVMTFEGVLGMEHDKDSRDINPVHDLILPFTRMAAGPMDYTPGAVGNATADDYYINFVHPISLGTRAHQAALYVVYESPLQMLADSPSRYYDAPEFISFISQIPTVWDETKAISAKIGEELLVARKNGDKWYMGGLTDWNERSMEVELDFLDANTKYKMNIFADGVNANSYASDYKEESKIVTKGERVNISMAKGGGWAAILTPEK